MPEPSRLLQQPEEPFQAVLPDPAWRLPNPPRGKVERGAHADHDGHANGRAVRVHPTFLLRRAQPNPQDVGRCADNTANQKVSRDEEEFRPY